MALAEAVLRQAEDLRLLINQMETGFSFEHAVGVQLDLLGESISVPRQEGWDDETYRAVLLRKLKLWTWDGTNGSVPAFLSAGETLQDHDDCTVTVHTESGLPVPTHEIMPVPAGVQAMVN